MPRKKKKQTAWIEGMIDRDLREVENAFSDSLLSGYGFLRMDRDGRLKHIEPLTIPELKPKPIRKPSNLSSTRLEPSKLRLDFEEAIECLRALREMLGFKLSKRSLADLLKRADKIIAKAHKKL